MLNDPYQGGTHTPDVTFTTPIFFEDTLLGFGVCRAHWTDVGGGGAGGQAFGTHIAAEGLRLPPVKIMERGELNQDFVEIIRNATRVPQYVDGDIQAQLGALKAAEIELTRLARRYGVATLREAQREVLDYTERMTARRDRAHPGRRVRGGRLRRHGRLQPRPDPAAREAHGRGDQITVDFYGHRPGGDWLDQLAVREHGLRRLLRAEVLPQPGRAAERRVSTARSTLEIPEGTWLNPRWPAPTIALHDARLVEDLRGHLARAGEGDPGPDHRPDLRRVQLVRRERQRPGQRLPVRVLRPACRRLGRDALPRRHERDAWTRSATA